jgi:hypothetical protein
LSTPRDSKPKAVRLIPVASNQAVDIRISESDKVLVVYDQKSDTVIAEKQLTTAEVIAICTATGN